MDLIFDNQMDRATDRRTDGQNW